MRTDLHEYLTPPDSKRQDLPPVDDAAALLAESVETPPAVVDGLLRRGEVGVLGGASKSFKSWAALDLAVSVASGTPWLGRTVQPGRVLVCNLELPRWCVRSRVQSIAHARGIRIAADTLGIWTLRGLRIKAEELEQSLPEHASHETALIIIDPVYLLLAGRDENSAGDIADLLHRIGGVARSTGAHVLIPAHFAKGDASVKQAQDRVSGSGVFARYPDSLLTLTKHEEDGAYVLESVLRTFPPAAAVTLRWQHPAFTIDEDLDPTRLRKANGRSQVYSDESLVEVLRGGRMGFNAWCRACEEATGIGRRTFAVRVKRLLARRMVIKSATGDAYYVPESGIPIPTNCTDEPPPTVQCGAVLKDTAPAHRDGGSAESAESAESSAAPTKSSPPPAAKSRKSSTRKRRS